jgi:hypothetical protein
MPIDSVDFEVYSAVYIYIIITSSQKVLQPGTHSYNENADRYANA